MTYLSIYLSTKVATPFLEVDFDQGTSDGVE